MSEIQDRYRAVLMAELGITEQDADDAIASLPEPLRAAVTAAMQTREGLAMLIYSLAMSLPEEDVRRALAAVRTAADAARRPN